MRRRISILRENRIWDLRSQGYSCEAIGSIVDVHPSSVGVVVRRVRRRPDEALDPVRRGRYHSWLSDFQVAEIRRRRQEGETLLSIARDFHLGEVAISRICRGETYQQPETRGYPYSFRNRLLRRTPNPFAMHAS
jgi:transposase